MILYFALYYSTNSGDLVKFLNLSWDDIRWRSMGIVMYWWMVPIQIIPFQYWLWQLRRWWSDFSLMIWVQKSIMAWDPPALSPSIRKRFDPLAQRQGALCSTPLGVEGAYPGDGSRPNFLWNIVFFDDFFSSWFAYCLCSENHYVW